MPDPRRGEVVNVGLVVFKNDELDVRVINASAKLRMLDGKSSVQDIESLKNAFVEIGKISSDIETARSILKTFKLASYLSDEGEFTIDDEGQYDNRVRSLFKLLITPYSSKERVTKTHRILTQLKEKFESLDLLARNTDDLSRHKVVYNYPLNEKSGFHADFLLKNGRFHITEAIDFNVNDLNSKLKETSMKMMTFMEGRKALGEDTGSFFVYSARDAIKDEISAHLNLAKDYSDQIFNLDCSKENARYFDIICSLAGQNRLIH